MGYACPVCGAPQADGEHLANHLAFTALLHTDDHETWLDQRVPDWETLDPEALADRVVEFATETEYPEVFEDTTDGHDHDRDYDHHHDHGSDVPAVGGLGDEPTDEAVEQIVARAREWTRRSRDVDDADQGSDTDTDTDEE